MRIALISDMHGNLIALDVALADIRAVGIDQLVCLGDVAAGGPQAPAVVARLRELAIPCVRGNADDEMLGLRRFEVTSDDTRRIAAQIEWSQQQLAPADLDFIRAFQPTISVPLENGQSLLCFHGSPRANTEIIVAATPNDELAPMFADVQARVCAGGHTHTQMLRRYQNKFIINPGSVGLGHEYRGTTARNVPWAEYALIQCEGERIGIEFRRAPFDVESLKRVALVSGMPHAEWWAEGWG